MTGPEQLPPSDWESWEGIPAGLVFLDAACRYGWRGELMHPSDLWGAVQGDLVHGLGKDL